jgi:hypothetical protein
MQVQVTSKEDKRGLTACVTTTLAGIVLALQLIYGGQREKSLPRKEARSEAEAVGFVHVCEERTDLLPPREQSLLLQLDVYSVHRDAPFRD